MNVSTVEEQFDVRSAYHHHFRERPLGESRKTAFNKKSASRGYHLDYICVPRGWARRIARMEVGQKFTSSSGWRAARKLNQSKSVLATSHPRRGWYPERGGGCACHAGRRAAGAKVHDHEYTNTPCPPHVL